MIFRAQHFELYKADGHTVCGIGVEWTEARTFVEGVLVWLGKGFLFMSAITGVGALVVGKSASGPPAGALAVAAILLFGMFWAAVRASVRLPGKVNSIEFHEDGRIWSSCQGEWQTKVQDIRNVESEQLKQKKTDEDSSYTHGVRMITRRGRVLRVATNIEPDDAITLAVLLSEAIEAVRYPQVTTTIGDQPVAVW